MATLDVRVVQRHPGPATLFPARPVHFSATARLMSDALRCIVLRGAGLEVHVAPLGATLVKVLTPDRTGAVADVALGYDTASAYKQASTYFGAVVGRCANRIAKGRFSLGGLSYLLACNNPPNALHGGPTGFHVREWAVEALLDGRGVPLPNGTTGASPAGVRLAYTSAAGEEGYPGELSVSVTYLLREDDGRGEGAEGTAHAYPSLLTRFSARVRGDETIVNLAQHCYWNLGGHDSGSVLASHSLRLNSSLYTPVDDTLIPDGRLAPVANTPFDFTQPVQLGLHAAEVPGGRGFDHNFVLMGPNAMRAASTPPEAPSLAAELYHAGSGRHMRLFTDAPGVQLYVGGFLDAEPGKGGAVYPQHGGLCLETQNFPDAVNRPGVFPSPVLREGEEYVHTMVTQFAVVAQL